MKKYISNIPIRHFFLNILLALLWAIFLYANLSAFIAAPRLTLLLFVLTQTEFIIFLLVRRAPLQVSKNWNDYFIAIAGTFIALLFQPTVHVAASAGTFFFSGSPYIGDILIYVAVLFEISAYLSLNTSTGIAPANRGIKTRGMYRFVRHPIYASYMLLYAGYVINNPSSLNWVILLLAFTLQTLRIQREEAVLKDDPVYREYASRVAWKLVPGVF